jgi:hypothetical protein
VSAPVSPELAPVFDDGAGAGVESAGFAFSETLVVGAVVWSEAVFVCENMPLIARATRKAATSASGTI